jgi:glycosyltransferase involved in cell wall biosynthesis
MNVSPFPSSPLTAMKWTKENIRYCLITWDTHLNKHVEQQTKTEKKIIISGLYLWANALGGHRSFPWTRTQCNELNLIHVNLTPNNLPLITRLNEIRDPEKTKLLVNIDFAIEMWYPNLRFPALMIQQLETADYVFAVEQRQAEIVSMMLHKEIPCIPHPVDVTGLKKYRVKSSREKRVVVSAHRYDQNFLLPALVLREAVPFEEGWVSGCINSTNELNMHINHLYNENQPPLGFEQTIKYLAESYACLESYTIHSYGRTVAECAALGVPCIGPNYVGSMKCFPDLITECNDLVGQADLLKRLIRDQEFYTACGIKGLGLAEEYSLENSATKMIDFLNSLQE